MDRSNLFELRSRSAELLRVPESVALGSPRIVRRMMQHKVFCGLLRIPETSSFRRMRAETILSEGISDSLSRCDISDRILSCKDVPELNIIDFRDTGETKDIPYSERGGGSADDIQIEDSERGGLAPREESSS